MAHAPDAADARGDDLATVLARVEAWEPAVVAVGVSDPRATLATHGPVDRVLKFASVTKPLTAYAVLIAARDGLVHLDEPVEGAGVPAGARVRHLLAHASGLPPERDGPGTRPERKRIYSNYAYELLGALIAERSGTPFAEHLDLEVLRPLGMLDTELDGSPAHGGRGTVIDLLSFARELMSPTLLDEELLAEATGVAFPGLDGVVPGYGSQAPCDWGLGFELKDAKDPHWTGASLAPETFGHFGGAGSFLWIDPTRRLACAELADQRFGPWARDAWPAFHDAVVAACAP